MLNKEDSAEVPDSYSGKEVYVLITLINLLKRFKESERNRLIDNALQVLND